MIRACYPFGAGGFGSRAVPDDRFDGVVRTGVPRGGGSTCPRAYRSAYGLGMASRKSYSGATLGSATGFLVGMAFKRRCSPRTDDAYPVSLDEYDHEEFTRR